MPSLVSLDDHDCDDYVAAAGGAGNGFWSKHRDDVSSTQLQKFWSVLTPQARQELLRIDKPMLFEQARKNMYCSRCNGLLLEGFVQVVMYGKSLQQEGVVSHHVCDRSLKLPSERDFCSDGCECGDIQDPSIHPWGGLTTTREGMLTLLDCYLNSKSLKGLQNVFDSARAREREREMLYPDACGGGGRGWISQGMVGYGRSHGTRETCALHTARLSVGTLVDFWAALGEETRLSLLRMKEDDFIERLMFRFDSKRFCRDCRRNVIREFKELKELKRTKKETRCTTWFCVADAAFQCEVTHDTVKVDFHKSFGDDYGSYSNFEWAVGTGEGKSDIADFKVVGKREGPVQARGLDLSGLNSCHITLRATKVDGRLSEVSVKAHALKGQQCVHCRLVVGDGFVTITRGDSIRSFFEHAEEAEEEEDDESMDKDGNDLDGECSRPQKHAKSPELAREFLLDAAAVIFKEQVEKAFREGTARQNAHSIFVCLALKLLEDRLHVACKEIITLEKQAKLLEEEEKEKREEEERKERKKMKEREKKLRRKERLREKEKDREKKSLGSNPNSAVPEPPEQESATVGDEESNVTCDVDLVSETGEAVPSGSVSPEIQDDQLFDEFVPSDEQSQYDAEVTTNPDDHLKYSRQKQRYRKEHPQGGYSKWSEKRRYNNSSENGSMVGKYEPRHHHGDNFEAGRRNTNTQKSNARNAGNKYGERYPCPSNRIHDKYDPQSCSCNQYNDYRPKGEQHNPRVVRENKPVFKSESASDMSKTHHREFARENSGRSKGKPVNGSNHYHRDSPVPKKVWEPMDSQKKYSRSNSDSDVTLRGSTSKSEAPNSVEEVADGTTATQVKNEDKELCETKKSEQKVEEKEGETMICFSNSDNCSSCLSEGDSNTSLKSHNTESSTSSDSEDASQHSEGRAASPCHQNGLSLPQEGGILKDETGGKEEPVKSQADINVAGINPPALVPSKPTPNSENIRANPCSNPQPQVVHPQIHNQNIQYPVFQPSPVGYYHQAPVPWAAPPPSNGFMPIPTHNQYVYANPFGYGLNGNAHFMQYGTLQHPAAAVLHNRNHVPVFQPLSRGNEMTKMPKPGPLKEVPVQSVAPASVQHKDTPVATESKKVQPKPDKFEPANAGFSLFHFGGPVDLPTGLKSEPPVLSGDLNGGDQNCDKKNSIEEYNLFAASNGIKFSIF